MPILAYDDRIVGTDGFITYEDPNNEEFEGPFEVQITSWSIRSSKSFQDKTNSENYDQDTDLIYPTRFQVAVHTEGAITGRFRMAMVPITFVTAMYSGEIIPVITFYQNENREFGNGKFTIHEFEVSSPIDDVVNYSCKIVGYGPFSPNLQPYELSAEAYPTIEPGDGGFPAEGL